MKIEPYENIKLEDTKILPCYILERWKNPEKSPQGLHWVLHTQHITDINNNNEDDNITTKDIQYNQYINWCNCFRDICEGWIIDTCVESKMNTFFGLTTNDSKQTKMSTSIKKNIKDKKIENTNTIKLNEINGMVSLDIVKNISKERKCKICKNTTRIDINTPTSTPTSAQKMKKIFFKLLKNKETINQEKETQNDNENDNDTNDNDNEKICKYCGAIYCNICSINETKLNILPSRVLWYGDIKKYIVCKTESEKIDKQYSDPLFCISNLHIGQYYKNSMQYRVHELRQVLSRLFIYIQRCTTAKALFRGMLTKETEFQKNNIPFIQRCKYYSARLHWFQDGIFTPYHTILFRTLHSIYTYIYTILHTKDICYNTAIDLMYKLPLPKENLVLLCKRCNEICDSDSDNEKDEQKIRILILQIIQIYHSITLIQINIPCNTTEIIDNDIKNIQYKSIKCTEIYDKINWYNSNLRDYYSLEDLVELYQGTLCFRLYTVASVLTHHLLSNTSIISNTQQYIYDSNIENMIKVQREGNYTSCNNCSINILSEYRCKRCNNFIGSNRDEETNNNQDANTTEQLPNIILPIPEPIYINELKQYSTNAPTNLRLKDKSCMIRLVIPHSKITNTITAEVINITIPPPSILYLYTRMELWNPICYHCNNIFHPICFGQHIQSFTSNSAHKDSGYIFNQEKIGYYICNNTPRGYIPLYQHFCTNLSTCNINKYDTKDKSCMIDFIRNLAVFNSLIDIVNRLIPLDQRDLHSHTQRILYFLPSYILFSFSER